MQQRVQLPEHARDHRSRPRRASRDRPRRPERRPQRRFVDARPIGNPPPAPGMRGHRSGCARWVGAVLLIWCLSKSRLCASCGQADASVAVECTRTELILCTQELQSEKYEAIHGKLQTMKLTCTTILGFALHGVLVAFAPTTEAGETPVQEPDNYARSFEPPTRPAFIPLPPGDVEPQGWLRDRAERAFNNTGPATVSRDFKTHGCFQSPNRFADKSPDFPHGPRGAGGNYQQKHGPLCCTAALNRIVRWFVTHMWMATYDNGLAATCYGPCKVTALAANRVLTEIACSTDYPFSEIIEVSVRPAREAVFARQFRIPAWCANRTLGVNGAAIAIERNVKGFARINRSWKPSGDQRPRAAYRREAGNHGPEHRRL
jgi:hypothetical protein